MLERVYGVGRRVDDVRLIAGSAVENKSTLLQLLAFAPFQGAFERGPGQRRVLREAIVHVGERHRPLEPREVALKNENQETVN